MIKRRIKFLLILILLVFAVPTLPQLFHKNHGTSVSHGTVNKGKLYDGYKLPYKGTNFKFFSVVDYFLVGRCYLHSDIHKIIISSYKELASVYPNYTFRIMEGSQRKGGRAFPHRTHQNGTSIDFMSPLKKGDESDVWMDNIGLWRYLLQFDEQGKSTLDKDIVIDFNKIAHHIYILEKHARKNGYKIKKVILETNLKDELFDTPMGKVLNESGIYFVKSLPKRINELHDDHYHIDFQKL